MKEVILMNRISAIRNITNQNPNSAIIISNGLSSREANYFINNNRTFYMLHAMGEALSIGMGMAMLNKKLRVVVIDGDYNAIMGSASWHNLTACKNLKYFILSNRLSQTTGSQKVPSLSVPTKFKKYINIISIKGKKFSTPNPESPTKIKNKFKNWLKINNKI